MNINYPKIKFFDIRKDNKISKMTEEEVFGINAICIIANLGNDEHISIVKDILLKYDKYFFKVIINVKNKNLDTIKYNKLKDMYDAIITVSENELNECLYAINKLVNPDGPICMDLTDLKSVTDKSFISDIYIAKNYGYNIGEKCALQVLCNLANKYELNKIKKCILQITAGENVNLSDINYLAEFIQKNTNEDADVIFIFSEDKNLKNDEMKLIAFFSV